MADIKKVQTLSALDIVTDERRAWFVVEWKNAFGDPECAVCVDGPSRDNIIASLDADESGIVRYEILAPVGMDREDIAGYVSGGNSRLTW
jgi:hypothetical protein